MAAKSTNHKDPWRDLLSRRGNQQVGLEEVLPALSLEVSQARALKKDLIERISKLTRTP